MGLLYLSTCYNNFEICISEIILKDNLIFLTNDAVVSLTIDNEGFAQNSSKSYDPFGQHLYDVDQTCHQGQKTIAG